MAFGDWLDERTGIKEWIEKKKAQPVPAHVNIFYCFGGLSFFLILVQVVSGLFMLFFYVPDPATALDSINKMSNEVTLGWLFRNLHRWGATFLMATIFTHMVSVFYHKAYRRPRELNWVTGVFQFIVVFLILLTGIFLPWDWEAYWSFAIWVDYLATWPLIGKYLSELMLDTFTINRGFITHIWILPLLLMVLLWFHFRMVRKHGISGPL